MQKNIELIDSVTAEDVKAAANYIFANPSVTSVLASDDTIKYFEKSNAKKSA